MKKIALICKYNWAGFSTSLINTAIFWEGNGYQVDIYSEKPDTAKYPFPIYDDKNISYIITKISKTLFYDDIYFRFKHFKKTNYEYIIGSF